MSVSSLRSRVRLDITLVTREGGKGAVQLPGGRGPELSRVEAREASD